ncbi:hypothetical protein [Sphingomonas sp. KR3-1]|uniref:hypothetical protein n=1 Tax=Sphingomonas sp. KR3-1 TaxID=3156611 RepID=UPI0032B59FA1
MRLLLASAVLLAACAPAPQPRTAVNIPVELIEFRVSSWGKIVSEWSVQANGAASYTHAEGPGLGTRLVTREFNVGRRGVAQIRALLAPAEDAAGAMPPPECGDRWTDFPYGSIRWYKGLMDQALAFDLGCKNPKLKPIHDAVGAAEKQMASWSKTGEVIEDKEMNP